MNSIEYDIMLEGYELFHDEPNESDLIPWEPNPNQVYPIVLMEPWYDHLGIKRD